MRKDTKLPQTAEEWQLYVDKPGSGAAAGELARALRCAINAPSKDEARRIMREAMDRNAEWGARDTEPRNVAEQILEERRGERWDFDL